MVEEGDLLVAIKGNLVTTAQSVEVQLQAAVSSSASRQPSTSSASSTTPSTSERWMYKPANGLPIGIRSEPSVDATPSSHKLPPNTIFEVTETVAGKDDVLFLKLADGRGWLFDKRPCVGEMCVKATDEDISMHESGDVAEVALTLIRKGKVHEVVARVPLIGSDGARRLLCWNGLLLQEIPRSVKEYGRVPAGVHICEMLLGAPGEANGIEGDVVVAVDGIPIPNLDALLSLEHKGAEAAEAVPPGSRRHLRVETADLSGRRFMAALEPNLLFWPTVEISMDDQGVWSCVEHGQ